MSKQHKPQYDPIVCKSGLKMSVQASSTHYCDPQDDTGPYTSVEAGYPTEPVPELIPFIDGMSNDFTESVYAWVPLELVRQVVFVRGGLESGELPPHVETQIHLEKIE